ncbi:MAG: hypothetical protein M3419_03010 [Actinomycetota bacterium]|nr:hypothetical protein [Actinomycetota bacterium]
MLRKAATAGFATTALVAGGVAAAAPAMADDFKSRSGDCSRQSTYTMTLKEIDIRGGGDDDDGLRTTFFVNGTKQGATWRVTVKRSGKVVHRVTKRANAKGNIFVADRFRADDDAPVRVTARAGYGETCTRLLRLDDRDD